MTFKKIFTHVSSAPNKPATHSMCCQLPIAVVQIETVEELFPLLSDPGYHTDFVCIDDLMFSNKSTGLDMFDIINTLSILIKSTVRRTETGIKPMPRDTKICVLVDAETDSLLVKQIMAFPAVATVSWKIHTPEDLQSVVVHIEQIIAGDYTVHPKVSELIKPKKKATAKSDTITLTTRQLQVLKLVQDRGASNKTIAKILGLSESTIKLHMGAIFKKYGVKSRTQLAVFSTMP